ncbi:MAG: hypothetical protein V7K67_23865 [Nostoc sp.]|uniref:hypothetical protein n=1 Tax=Nostoc sp. TaxID=1180 RepID=UPI002FF936D4
MSKPIGANLLNHHPPPFIARQHTEYFLYHANSLSPNPCRGLIKGIDGVRHRRERKLLMPPFHGEKLQAYPCFVTPGKEKSKPNFEL